MSQVFPVECDDAGNAIPQTSEFYEEPALTEYVVQLVGVRDEGRDCRGRRYFTGHTLNEHGQPSMRMVVYLTEGAA